MVKLSNTLLGIVLLSQVAFELVYSNSVAMKLISAIFNENADDKVSFAPQMLIDSMKVLYTWSDGQTAVEINKVMQFKKTRQLDEKKHRKKNKEEKQVMSIASNMFLSKDVKPTNGIHVVEVNFNDTDKAKATMNDWVASVTNNKIKNLVEEVNPKAKIMCLIGTYYEPVWKYKFFAKDTKKLPFYTSLTQSVPTDLMCRTGIYLQKYIKTVDANVLHLPFKTKSVKMLILLPTKIDGLQMLINNLSKLTKKDLSPKGMKKKFRIELPKFEVDFRSDLKPTLQGLGINSLFTNANLSHLTDHKSVLYIDSMLQQIYLKINEKGTVVAAGSRKAPLKVGPDFKVNHPFVFLVKKKDDILFAGRISSIH